MAIAYDSSSAGGPNSSSSSVSWAHTTGGGSNLVAVVFVAAAGGTLQTVSSVKYGTQNCTQVPSSRVTSGSDFAELWYLIAPSGNQTVAVTLSGTQSVVGGGIVILSGADQTSPLHTAATNSGSGAAVSVSPASDTTEMVVGGGLDDFNASGWSLNITTGTGRFSVGNTSGGIAVVGGTQTGANPTATMTWTETGGANNSLKLVSAISIIAAGAGGGTQYYPFLSLLGVG